MKRPLAYITAPWGDNDFDNRQNAARYCRQVYEAGYSPICPILYLLCFLHLEIPREAKDRVDMAAELLRRSRILVVCGSKVTQEVKNDIALAKHLRIAATTLEGILTVDGNHYGWESGDGEDPEPEDPDAGSTDEGENGSGNTNNTGGSQNQSGILFPEEGEVSELEDELIGMIKTSGHEKNYELIEYVNDVNRENAEVLMELNINGKMDTAYSYGNERLTVERFDGWTGYYTYDPRGSVSGVTGSDGYLWQSYRYDPFGDISFGKPQYNNVYAYNAESFNPNLDTIYLRARYYYTSTANFLSEDTYLGDISDPLTLNRYNYALSSYLNYKDPSGHGVWEWLKDIFGFGEDEEEESKPVKETEPPTTSVPKTTTKSTESKKKMDEAEKKAKTETCSSLEVPISKELMEELHWEPMTDKELNQLIEVLEKYEINTVNRMAYFFAQTRQETLGGYWKVEQNWSDGSVSDEKYFNEKYGPNTNSGKNVGNTKEGDGYLYRGAGAIQLTGRYNYQKFADAMDDPKIMELGADYVAENYFWEAGGYFWDLKNINEKIDDGATSDDISRIVNKYDKDTFDAREEKYKEAYKTLNEWKSNLN